MLRILLQLTLDILLITRWRADSKHSFRFGEERWEVEGKRDLPLSPNPSYRWAAALGMEKSEQVLIKPDDLGPEKWVEDN